MVDVSFFKLASPRKIFVPSANSECLCGSGAKFKYCCSDSLPGFDIGKKAEVAVKVGNYDEALLAYRSDVSQYTIWHRTNTAPLLSAKQAELPEALNHLLTVDVEALADCIDSLRWCYVKLNRSDEFPAVLERLRSNISHPRWQRRIVYLQVIEVLQPDWNEEAGRREFKKLGSMDGETDVEILQLYIDLFAGQLGLADRLKFVDRVIKFTHSEAERMHYRALKAVYYMFAGDITGAKTELQASVDAFTVVQNEYESSEYAMSYYAISVGLLGNLKRDIALLDQSLSILKKLLARENWSASGRASLILQQGDVLRYKAEWAEAQEVYLASLKTDGQEICKVFIAECLLNLNEPIAAQEMLGTVVREHLDPSGLADYVFTLAVVAIQCGGQNALANAEAELRRIQLANPYFKERRDSLLVSVIDTIRSGPSSVRSERARGVLRAVFSTLLRYVKLEPNVMGIGLNVGRFLEDHLGEQAHSDTGSKKTKH